VDPNNYCQDSACVQKDNLGRKKKTLDKYMYPKQNSSRNNKDFDLRKCFLISFSAFTFLYKKMSLFIYLLSIFKYLCKEQGNQSCTKALKIGNEMKIEIILSR